MRWPLATGITIKLGLAAIIRSVLVCVNWPAENMSLSLIALKIGVDLKVRIKFNAQLRPFWLKCVLRVMGISYKITFDFVYV